MKNKKKLLKKEKKNLKLEFKLSLTLWFVILGLHDYDNKLMYLS